MAGPTAAGAGQFVGQTYAAILAADERDRVLAVLSAERFTGWLGPHADGWCVAVPDAPLGHVARRRARVDELAVTLAGSLDGLVVCVEVEADRVLRIWAGTRDGEVIDYVSDVSSDDAELTLDPFGNPMAAPEGPSGAECAGALARSLGLPLVADELTDLLREDLGESTSESERLEQVARLLGWPAWLVSVGSLPRDVPGGPDRRAFTRLRAGRGGLPGMLTERGTRVVRRRA